MGQGIRQISSTHIDILGKAARYFLLLAMAVEQTVENLLRVDLEEFLPA